MRKKIVAGNWKMNLSITAGVELTKQVVNSMADLKSHQQVIFCTPFTHLSAVHQSLVAQGKPNVRLGAQNCHPSPSGAFTGEISIDMLKEVGVQSVIIGHSERRQYFNEDHAFLKQKVDALVEAKQQILFCCGEPLAVREAGTENDYVLNQLKESVFHLSADDLSNHVVIAYEPIWAIGTGVTASTQQAQDMHAFIRESVAQQYGQDVADKLSILYGGSCNAGNAKELFACPDVDGGLIGGAALKADTFLPIIEALA